MTIANEIERLMVAKNDIKKVLSNRNVFVPENVTLEEYSKYVDMINNDTSRDDDEVL